MALETRERINIFSVSFEEAMISDHILREVIKNEGQFLESVQPYLELLSADYSHRREYVQYCEMQRKSMDLVNLYLSKMI